METRPAGPARALLLCLVQMEDSPRVAQVSITKCASDMQGYCLHGQCIYLVDMSENYCRCDVGYTGVRCEHFFLTVHQPLSKEYVALTVILVILTLVIVAGSIYYFCRCILQKCLVSPEVTQCALLNSTEHLQATFVLGSLDTVTWMITAPLFQELTFQEMHE
ncbi:Proepiregulin [Heterocephalus glaber]|uniref:Proepiregulin n=1 Tax=Heterocephalus glaber TaxID=10181 RepID=G5BU10_HETGA|nr:Proepiregulin [Heterocephalus glaber]